VYCQRDTLALVEMHRALMRLASNPGLMTSRWPRLLTAVDGVGAGETEPVPGPAAAPVGMPAPHIGPPAPIVPPA
jgi:hypothetical protein